MNPLTPRQAEIAELVARGWTNKRISKRLDIALRTVEDHVADAAARIPGEGRPRYKCIVWFFNQEAGEQEAA